MSFGLPLPGGRAKFIVPLAFAAIVVAATPALAGGLLGRLLFGSLDDAQAECLAQNPGNFSNTWRCIRARVAQGHTGDMQNGAAMKYMATGDMLYSNVQARKLDDATALYHLANALSIGDLEYSATHPAPAFRSFTCHDFGYSTTCY